MLHHYHMVLFCIMRSVTQRHFISAFVACSNPYFQRLFFYGFFDYVQRSAPPSIGTKQLAHYWVPCLLERLNSIPNGVSQVPERRENPPRTRCSDQLQPAPERARSTTSTTVQPAQTSSRPDPEEISIV